MKFTVQLIFTVLVTSFSLSQTIIEFESFEGTPAEWGYTADNWRDGFSDYHDVVNELVAGNPAPVAGYHIQTGIPLNVHDDGTGASHFWAVDDLDDGGNPRADDLGIITMDPADVTGVTNLQLVIGLSQGRAVRFENDDYIRIYYAFDGDITGHPGLATPFTVGAYTQLIEFRGSGPGTDLSENGSGSNSLPTGNLTDYTFNIAGTGTSISVRIVMETDSGDEEILIDNIRLVGVTSLPVELSSFTTEAVGGNVELNWETVSELNNDFFTLERTKDGINWEALRNINGAGNSNEVLKYSEVDRNPLLGQSYYRLKQTDFNGDIAYSPVASVYAKSNASHYLNVYPNPTDRIITVEKEGGIKEIRILNSIGQTMVDDVTINTVSENRVIIDLGSLPMGVYFVKIDNLIEKVALAGRP